MIIKLQGEKGGNFRKKSFLTRKRNQIRKNFGKKPLPIQCFAFNRYVANSVFVSRREADILLAAGSVTVNGKAVIEMGKKVAIWRDESKVFDGRLLNPIKKRVYCIRINLKDFFNIS